MRATRGCVKLAAMSMPQRHSDPSHWQATLASKDETIQSLQTEVASLRHQIDWFKRQMFGRKSERVLTDNPRQLALGEFGQIDPDQPVVTTKVPAHSRRKKAGGDEASETGLFFDPEQVPVRQILVLPDGVREADLGRYDRVNDKISYRLAQQPGSFVVLAYVRPVLKDKAGGALVCAPAPTGVVEGRYDVSFGAGMLVDKFCYHLPLYRQHQRLMHNGITVARGSLTRLAGALIELLRPIEQAQRESICASRVIAMDETTIKAGRDRPGTMHQGYYWPIYGDQHEVCFPYASTRQHAVVPSVLDTMADGSVLLSDGYAAYARYAARTGITQACCWAHARREFFDARTTDPAGTEQALARIGELYAIEQVIRDRKLAGESKRMHRLTYSKPRVEAFFEWVESQFQAQGLLPSSPYTKALAYALRRRVALSVFLADPEVSIDTNHVERALRSIPMGRKNWMFCWTELGAEHVGIVQGLLTTCRLHDVDPYTWLVDVLQRVGQHPARDVAQLTPRLWKQYFGDKPLRSNLHPASV
jgi:transposase